LPVFNNDTVEREDLTPTIGSIFSGVQLSKLDDAGKDQLARLAAERKVLLFRNQDFADLPIDEAKNIGRYFGRLHIHPTSGAPVGHPEIHLVHRGTNDKAGQVLLENRLSTVAWHSDVTYEEQPPGTTFLYILDKPKTGGDTIFANMVEAYNRLSPAFQERLHGLSAVHSGIEQAEASKARDSITRREPVTNVHPIVRTHPITGEKALFVNPQCEYFKEKYVESKKVANLLVTRYIVGLKKEESDVLLKFLYDHISFGQDFQARVKWEEKAVIVWDVSLRSYCIFLLLNLSYRTG
jgi:sulfonate dioxygenase